MSKTRVLFLFLILSVLSACASSGKLSTLPKVTDLSNACDAYIIREASIVGAALSYTVAIDHQNFVKMGSGDYTNIKTECGAHILAVKYPRQMFLGTAEKTIDFEFKENKKIYIQMSPGLSVKLEILPDEKGAEIVKKSKYIDVN